MHEKRNSPTHAVGVDIIEIGRINQAVERWGKRFLARTYTRR